MTTLFNYTEALGCLKNVVFDVSLIPHRDWYSGVLIEGVLLNDTNDTIVIGGRFDSLIARMSPPNAPASPVGVGVSFNIDKIVNICSVKGNEGESQRPSEVDVFLCSIGNDVLLDKMQLASELWSYDIRAEFLGTSHPTLNEQLDHCREIGVTWVIILHSKSYMLDQTVKIRHLARRTETTVARGEVVKHIQVGGRQQEEGRWVLRLFPIRVW